jgi:ferritin-like metal-binding protein YciE
MASNETPARDAVLVKYLNEAFGKEKQLEQNLTVLVARAQNHKTLKKGFQDHLRVTKNQARGLQQRIKALGGKAEIAPDLPGPDRITEVASTATNLANRAVAMAKGPVQLLRGTGEADNMLRNVRDAFWNEAEEIAHYKTIEAVADKLNDKETVKLAKQFRREEEKMQTFLERELNKLVTQVVRDEVPAAERRNGGTRRRKTTRKRSTSSAASSNGRARTTKSRSSSAKRTTAAKRTTSAKRTTAAKRTTSTKRSQAAKKAAATRARKSARTSAKRTTTKARSTARSAGKTARKAGRAARTTARSASR